MLRCSHRCLNVDWLHRSHRCFNILKCPNLQKMNLCQSEELKIVWKRAKLCRNYAKIVKL